MGLSKFFLPGIYRERMGDAPGRFREAYGIYRKEADMDEKKLAELLAERIKERKAEEKDKPERLSTPIFTHTGKRTFRY